MHIIYPKRLRYPHSAANHIQATAMVCSLSKLLPVHMYPSLAGKRYASIAEYFAEEYHFTPPKGLVIHQIPFQGLTTYNVSLDCAAALALQGRGAVAYTRDVDRGGFCLQVRALSPRRFFLVHEVHDFRRSEVLKKVLAKADGIIFIHDELRLEAEARFGFNKPYCIAQSGFSQALFSPPEHRPLPGKPEGPCLLAYVGTIREDKGVDILLDMIRRLPERFHLKLIGEPAFRDTKLFSDLLNAIPHGRERITFTGRVPHHEVARAMDDAHMMLLPPAPEGKYLSQIKVFEALGCGLPMVAAPLNRLTSFLRHGETAWFARGKAAGDLAKAVEELAEQPQMLYTLGKNAARLSRQYTWDARARHILDFTEQVTGLKAQPPA